MDCIKKTILLTNDKKQISVLNLNRTNNGIFANIKNFSKVADNCVLGICVNGIKVYKQNIVCNKNSGYDFKLNRDFDLNAKIGCVLYYNLTPIMWGCNGDIVNYKGIIGQYLQNTYHENVTKTNTLIANKTNIGTSNLNDEEINIKETYKEVEDLKEDTNNIKDEEGVVKLYGCRDSDTVPSSKLFETSDEEIEEAINKEFKVADGPTFFEMISEQLDDLFEKYPEEPNLANVVPNSKWVKVNYENNGNEYVLGLLYELETVKYVAYGVPAKKDDEVPDNLTGFSQWIPINSNDINGEGYFVMFQDAQTGESVKI